MVQWNLECSVSHTLIIASLILISSLIHVLLTTRFNTETQRVCIETTGELSIQLTPMDLPSYVADYASFIETYIMVAVAKGNNPSHVIAFDEPCDLVDGTDQILCTFDDGHASM